MLHVIRSIKRRRGVSAARWLLPLVAGSAMLLGGGIAIALLS